MDGKYFEDQSRKLPDWRKPSNYTKRDRADDARKARLEGMGDELGAAIEKNPPGVYDTDAEHEALMEELFDPP